MGGGFAANSRELAGREEGVRRAGSEFATNPLSHRICRKFAGDERKTGRVGGGAAGAWPPANGGGGCRGLANLPQIRWRPAGDPAGSRARKHFPKTYKANCATTAP